MIDVLVFGKKMCSACNETKQEFSSLADENKIKLTILDMDTINGLTEAALNNVKSIPTTIFKQGEKIIAKWENTVPLKKEYEKYL